MNQTEYQKNAKDMLYLTICAITGKKPEAERIQDLNLETLFQVCQKHILTACTAYALESVGIKDHSFQQAKEKAIRKNILLDAERTNILERLEQEKIWYMPLKGAILKNWYPKLGMRQMSDNDILCDPNARKQVRQIMLDMGFSCEHFETSHDDAYYKPPVCNFEMHHQLFLRTHSEYLYLYYKDIKSKLIKDAGHEYGYHFRPEDFYIYLIAHEYKHFSDGGTGVRSFVDIYVFMKKFQDSMNWDYIKKELNTLHIAEYEYKSRILSEKLFCEEPLSEEETELLNYCIFSGTYGTAAHHVENHLKEKSKIKYLFQRIFPSMQEIKDYWNFFYRHKYLIPFLWIYRVARAVTFKRKAVITEIKELSKSKGGK